MCRITGIINLEGKFNPELETQVLKMRDSMTHGGPDDKGIFVDKEAGVALGNRRLAIIDLSPLGHQPMGNEKETIWITYNGEIYNFREIRELLIAEGHRFKSNSDTEVIIHGYEEWGEEVFDRFVGMFAFCIYDRQKGLIYLVRDHAGIKPLYYAMINNTLIFASEVKAFKTLNKTWKENPDWKIYLLIFGHIPEPSTTLKDVYMLPKGGFLKLDLKNKRYTIKKYTKIDFSDEIKNLDDAIYGLKHIFKKAVKRHLISDAPIGVFLSGGIDSSLISLVASEFQSENLRTLSVIFNENDYNEERYQKIVYEKIKSQHTSYLVTENDFINSLDDIFSAMDQPTTDGVNTYFIAKCAKEAGLKTVLSGLGGDELFGGYPSFRLINVVAPFMVLSGRSRDFSPVNNLFGLFQYFPHNRLKKLSFLSLPSPLSYYLLFRSLFTIRETARLLDITEKEVFNKLCHSEFISESHLLNFSSSHNESCIVNPVSMSSKNFVSALETNLYMQNQLLKDSDFMSMWHSVELRVPFLDKDLMKFIFSIDEKIKFKNNIPKFLLKESFNDIVPSEIVKRPKMGFTFPFQEWMRNNLKLFSSDIVTNGDINSKHAKDLLHKFEVGKLRWSRLWALIVLNRWSI